MRDWFEEYNIATAWAQRGVGADDSFCSWTCVVAAVQRVHVQGIKLSEFHFFI